VVEIGVMGGDGIGPEVVRAGMRVPEATAKDDPSLELACRIALLPVDAHVHLAPFSCLAAGAGYCLASSLRIFSRAPRMASVTSLVVAEPFRSGVRTSVSPSTCSMAETTPAPASSCPR
jgi:hypothetical protein